MLTAMQSARITATSNLIDARTKLADSRSLVCFDVTQSRHIGDIIHQVDGVLALLVPNVPADSKETT